MSPGGGDSTGEHDVVTVTVDTTGLAVGSYHCDVDISSDGGSGVFGVDLTVIPSGSYILDQEQDQSGYSYACYNSRWLGQSFIPTLDTLSKVDVLVAKRGNPTGDLVVSIRSTLTGNDLVSIALSPNDIPDVADWVECDLDDITITPGTTYYLVIHTVGGGLTNCYLWNYGYNTPYTNGAFQLSLTGGSSWI